ncbi:MAG TPA: carbamoyltransferase HypF [Acidimicrobiales bacterium]|nr:carbamoyltransferase HypF [Acidimicrobiales bacterium]
MPTALMRVRLRVTGTVQGVGFRPFVYRLAADLGLAGTVGNDSAGVVIEAEGPAAALVELEQQLRDQAPPLARVESVTALPLPPTGEHGFAIVDSVGTGAPDVPVSVDSATCEDCVTELFDPNDRRFRYPFVNCTNCGPRYTIVRSVPYDRPATTMAAFTMCAACQREYDDPADRRFHAQPNACPTCGPRVRLLATDGSMHAEGDDAVRATVAALSDGRIVAVKGLGGYHLAVDAGDESAVAELRRRKARDDKPFAVMVGDLAGARHLCDVDDDAERALLSPRRPIALAPRRADAPVAATVAPGLPELGVMLPYTPLHHLLLDGLGRPLVMTSGNLSDEPIAHTDGDALDRLAPVADLILLHDRAIHIRCDDSVVRPSPDGVRVLRRSRGYAPEPLRLPIATRRPLLAVGAELKSTVTVAKGDMVVASHHLGDLEHFAAYEAFRQAVGHLGDVFGVDPELVVHDLHPEYLSTKFALDLGVPTLGVQHHHAHIAACLAEHGETGRVLGVAFDGLGMGDDGTLWGGEFLVADLTGYQRVGHLLPVVLPGGTMAIREPWRMAVAWAERAGGADAAARAGAAADDRWPAVLDLVTRQHGMSTSSAGRLFDAVASLLGIRHRVTYEGQAAIELEALAGQVPRGAGGAYDYELLDDHGVLVLDPRPLVGDVIVDCERGVAPAAVADRFHRGMVAATGAAAARLAARHGCDCVALSGGVFQNELLRRGVAGALHEQGIRVLQHSTVPTNDGGISVGQAAIAAATS